MDPILVICVSFLTYCLVCFLQPCIYLLVNGWPLGSLVYDVSCFVTFPIWCPVLGVVLDCINF